MSDEPYELTSCFSSRAEFLEHFERKRSSGMFFHRAANPSLLPADLERGQIISVMIKFVGTRTDFHVHARVVDREDSRSGWWLQFLSDEKERQELVCTYAEGESVAYHRRRGERVASVIPVRAYRRSGEACDGHAINISGHGMQIRVSGHFEVETQLRLEIAFEGEDLPFRVAAKVVSVLSSRRQPSISVEFQFASSDSRDQMTALVAAC